MSANRLAALAIVTAIGVTACTAPPPSAPSARRLVTRERVAMGSLLKLSAWTDDEPKAVAAFTDIFHDFDRLEDLMSVWRPNSDVVRMNEAAGEHPVPISDDTRAVLVAARQASEWTNGKFDITFGALADIWKFDHDQDNSIPTAAAI